MNNQRVKQAGITDANNDYRFGERRAKYGNLVYDAAYDAEWRRLEKEHGPTLKPCVRRREGGQL